MKKILKNNSSTKKKLAKMKKVYLVCCGAKWHIREYYFAGKFKWDERLQDYFPLVYVYDDHNGTCDQWELRPIIYATGCFTRGWSFRRYVAELDAELLNFYDKEKTNGQKTING